MKSIEKLAVAQAVYKRIAKHVKTGCPDNLRGEVDAHFMDLYRETGAKSFDIKLGDTSVGSYSIAKKKPKPFMEIDWDKSDEDFMDWAYENDAILIDDDAIRRYIRETGEIPPSVTVREYDTDERLTPTLRIDDYKVEEALKGMLPETVAGLLEADDD